MVYLYTYRVPWFTGNNNIDELRYLLHTGLMGITCNCRNFPLKVIPLACPCCSSCESMTIYKQHDLRNKLKIFFNNNSNNSNNSKPDDEREILQ